MFAWISYFFPFFPINLQLNSSTLADTIWNRSWFLEKNPSNVLISCLRVFRHAIRLTNWEFRTPNNATVFFESTILTPMFSNCSLPGHTKMAAVYSSAEKRFDRAKTRHFGRVRAPNLYWINGTAFFCFHFTCFFFMGFEIWATGGLFFRAFFFQI